jgi:hypothetical protein
MRGTTQVALLVGSALAFATASMMIGSVRRPAPLLMGIYPGGPVGTVGNPVVAIADDPQIRMSALRRLRGIVGRAFVIRLYAGYTGGGSSARLAREILEEIRDYGEAGFRVELVLTYRSPQSDVEGYAAYVSGVVREVGPLAHVTFLQVTNEVNASLGNGASDGTQPGAQSALIHGVLAARAAILTGGFDHLKLGFSVAQISNQAAADFWQELDREGGDRFASAVDWVGVDLYPGTWGPDLGPGSLVEATGRYVTAALRQMREYALPLAGLGTSVALHVSEAGYPTGRGRSEAMQARVAEALVRAASDARGVYGVTDFRWFDLRDADSRSTSIEAHYGLTRDDGSHKLAFEVFRTLVARYGALPSARSPVSRGLAKPPAHD